MQQDYQALMNFDFLALSFARMQLLGQQVDVCAVTGNMNEQQKIWFQARFEYYLRYQQQTGMSQEQTLKAS